MKRIFLTIFLLIFTGTGCYTCPKQDLYFIATMSDGRPALINLDKGYLDERENWFNQEQRDELIERWNRYKQELREQEYNKRFGID